MGKVLSQQQIDQYHEQGFIAPIDVMPEEEALEYARRLQAAELEYPDELNEPAQGLLSTPGKCHQRPGPYHRKFTADRFVGVQLVVRFTETLSVF